jgi:sulfate permease, SulP family
LAYSLLDPAQGGVKNDVLSGLTVALALVPEAVAFAFVAGVSPIVGLYGAFMMGLVTSLIGGRPGMISGATGAMAVVMVSLVREGTALHGEGTGMGLQYLFVTLILCGMLQIGAGALRLGKFVRMIPSSVMMGFVNGLAIVILLSQLEMFRVQGEGWMKGPPLLTMLGLTGLTMAIMAVLPRFTKAVPAALTAIVVVTAIVLVGGVPTATVGSFIIDRGGEGLAAGLPSFAVPMIPLTVSTLWFVFPYACILAAVGLIESLMTLTLVDELTQTRGNANQECMAQGTANIVNGFFGGMGGCAMIGQSIINIQSGGRGRLSGLVAAVTLLGFILFASAYIEMVPIAALVGVMFMVVVGTFAWNTFKILNKVPAADVVVMLAVTGITVRYDLATAVITGVVLAALVFAWENALRIRARKRVDAHGIKHYEIMGPLFFGSTTAFLAKFDVAEDPAEVIIDFAESRIMDQSAIEAINKLAERYLRAGKTLHLRHLSADCTHLIQRAGDICDINVLEDPDYSVAIDVYQNSARAQARRLAVEDAKLELAH